MFVYRPKTQAAEAEGGRGEAGESSAHGYLRTRKGNSIFNSISSINDVQGDNRYSISPSS